MIWVQKCCIVVLEPSPRSSWGVALAQGGFGHPHQRHARGQEVVVKGADPPTNVGVVEFGARVGASAYEVLSATAIGVLVGATFNRDSFAHQGSAVNGA